MDRRLIWTDELVEELERQVAQRPSLELRQADGITWFCIIVGPLVVVALLVLLRPW